MDQKVFDQALQALREGEPIEGIVARHPREGDELRTLLELTHELRVTPAPPLPERWKDAEAEFLRAAAQRRFANNGSRGGRRQTDFGWLGPLFTRPLAVAMTILALFLLLSTGTVMASAQALPGDTLYTIKRAMENVQLYVSSKDSQAELLLDHTKERQRELAALVRQEAKVPGSLLHDLAHQAQASYAALAAGDAASQELQSELKRVSERSLQTLKLLAEHKPGTATDSLGRAQEQLMRTVDRLRAMQGKPGSPAATPTHVPETPAHITQPPGRTGTPPAGDGPPGKARSEQGEEHERQPGARPERSKTHNDSPGAQKGNERGGPPGDAPPGQTKDKTKDKTKDNKGKSQPKPKGNSSPPPAPKKGGQAKPPAPPPKPDKGAPGNKGGKDK